MKKMTCKQLGGACDKEFFADTFEEISKMSRQHGAEMFQKGEEAHLAAMAKMQDLMQNPQEMQKWFENKKKTFEEMADIE